MAQCTWTTLPLLCSQYVRLHGVRQFTSEIN
jgi:hypothetical protein